MAAPVREHSAITTEQLNGNHHFSPPWQDWRSRALMYAQSEAVKLGLSPTTHEATVHYERVVRALFMAYIACQGHEEGIPGQVKALTLNTSSSYDLSTHSIQEWIHVENSISSCAWVLVGSHFSMFRSPWTGSADFAARKWLELDASVHASGFRITPGSNLHMVDFTKVTNRVIIHDILMRLTIPEIKKLVLRIKAYRGNGFIKPITVYVHEYMHEYIVMRKSKWHLYMALKSNIPVDVVLHHIIPYVMHYFPSKNNCIQ